jgi:hypothetical protein
VKSTDARRAHGHRYIVTRRFEKFGQNETVC